MVTQHSDSQMQIAYFNSAYDHTVFAFGCTNVFFIKIITCNSFTLFEGQIFIIDILFSLMTKYCLAFYKFKIQCSIFHSSTLPRKMAKNNWYMLTRDIFSTNFIYCSF